MHVSPEQFALAVVASSAPSLAISEKFTLYTEAYQYALSKNTHQKKVSQFDEIPSTNNSST